MRRHLLLLAATLIISAAIGQTGYNPSHKYGLFSNLEIGASAQYSRSLTTNTGNIGADFRLTKRIGKNWRVRALADVDGFLVNGFDRKGTAFVGLSADFLPFYAFLDGGISYNPSSVQTINPAAEVGVGLQFNLGPTLRIFTEVGADRTALGNNRWNSDTFVKLGTSFNLGTTAADEVAVAQEENRKNMIAELRSDNDRLLNENRRQEEANRQLQATLDRATAACEAVERMYRDCNASLMETAPDCDLTVYFNCASSEINETDAARLRNFAAAIANGTDYYRIDGFASPEGKPINNERIAQERAESVYRYLIALGVQDYRIVPVGMGVCRDYASEATLNRIVRIYKVTK